MSSRTFSHKPASASRAATVELAAWVLMARAILNLNETLSKQYVEIRHLSRPIRLRPRLVPENGPIHWTIWESVPIKRRPGQSVADGTKRSSDEGKSMSQNDPAIGKPHFVITAEGELHGRQTPESLEIARRIEACFRACEGISTEELENGIIQDMRRVLAQVVPVLQEHK
jgi:hypothetical protein